MDESRGFPKKAVSLVYMPQANETRASNTQFSYQDIASNGALEREVSSFQTLWAGSYRQEPHTSLRWLAKGF